jgi:hypothetical protein
MGSEKYYTGLAKDNSLHVKLTGGWETVIGAMDTYGRSLSDLLMAVTLNDPYLSSPYSRV